MELPRIWSEDQLVDMLTKTVSVRYIYIFQKLGIGSSIETSSCGDIDSTIAN